MTKMMEMAAQQSLLPNNSPLLSWKLYDNPFYYYSHSHSQHHHNLHHCLQIPLSARKLAASLRRLTFFRPMDSILSMQSELDLACTQIEELKAELEFERRMRKKAELTKKRLEREAQEERERREAMERFCEDLAKEIAADRAEMDRMKKGMEEERKMWRVAEIWREERVRMKMAEARLLMEEKELEFCSSKCEEKLQPRGEDASPAFMDDFAIDSSKNNGNINNSSSSSSNSNSNPVRSRSQRTGSPEAENPHIKRGIKGFVEFPRVVRAAGSRGKPLGSKLECQKAQLRLFLRQKNPVGLGVGRPDNLNLVVG